LAIPAAGDRDDYEQAYPTTGMTAACTHWRFRLCSGCWLVGAIAGVGSGPIDNFQRVWKSL